MALSKEVKQRNGIISQIAISLLFPFLIIALIIYLSGFHGPIQFDNTYYNFMQRAAIESASWGVQIPNIPQIEYGSNVNDGFDILAVLVNIVNFLINLLNILIVIFNFVIGLFTTIAAIIKLLMDFGEGTYDTSGDLSYWVDTGRLLLSI